MNYELIKEIFRKKFKRAIVTGGAGFIGSHIVEELLEMGLEVISIDNFSAGKVENIEPFLSNKLFKNVNCDITNYEELRKHFEGVDIIFNQAASKKNICLLDPRRDLEVNAKGTFNLLELAKEFNVKKFIHASTGSVYGEGKVFPQTEDHPLEPVSYYGVSKLAGERYVKVFEQLYGLDATILRYFHVYGPRQESGKFGGVVSIFIRNILNEENPIIFGDGKQERSFTYVKDVVRANILVSTIKETKGEVYNCASGINITIEELCDMLLQILNAKGKMKKVYKDWQVGDIKVFNISNQKLCKLGFKFEQEFYKGLLETVEWMKSLHKNKSNNTFIL